MLPLVICVEVIMVRR